MTLQIQAFARRFLPQLSSQFAFRGLMCCVALGSVAASVSSVATAQVTAPPHSGASVAPSAPPLASVGVEPTPNPDNSSAAPAPTVNSFDFKAKAASSEIPAKANSVPSEGLSLPHGLPAFFGPVYDSVLRAPLPAHIFKQQGVPATVAQYEIDPDATGQNGSYQPAGTTATKQNAFFEPLGTNGRACITCHLPPDGMSVSVDHIVSRWIATGGNDPIFAPVDGANCPSLIAPGSTSGGLLGGITGTGNSDFEAAHSLLLTRGLFRIFLPIPQNAEFTVKVLHDPDGTKGCNTDPTYTSGKDPITGQSVALLSMYRRPRISASLSYVLITNSDSGVNPKTAVDPIDGSPVAVNVVEINPVNGKKIQTTIQVDPSTGRPISRNIMWDGREATLFTQAVDATLGHAQATNPPTEVQVAQMVQFEMGIDEAQVWDARAHRLTEFNGLGGPAFLSGGSPGDAPARATPPATVSPVPAFSLYDLWSGLPTGTDRAAQRASVANGQALFNSNQFTISNVAGFNNIQAIGNNSKGTCSSCHNQVNVGNDSFVAAQHDIGVGATQAATNPSAVLPTLSSDLPIFEFICKAGLTTPFNGSDVKTNDPGLAMTTGKCADIGRLTVPQLRALASRAPYFSDGSAATLLDVVNFYNTRFSINLTEQQKLDLVAFLRTL